MFKTILVLVLWIIGLAVPVCGQLPQAADESRSIVRTGAHFNLSDESLSQTNQESQAIAQRRSRIEPSSQSTDDLASAVDDYQLPQLADVNDPIPSAPLRGIHQQDPGTLLNNRHQLIEMLVGDETQYAVVTATPVIDAHAHWAAPNFYHRPLLLEETNLERYGNRRRLQPLASAAHFFGSIPAIPYKIGEHPWRYREYALKHHRPGDLVPYQRERFRLSPRGAILQAIVTTAIVIP